MTSEERQIGKEISLRQVAWASYNIPSKCRGLDLYLCQLCRCPIKTGSSLMTDIFSLDQEIHGGERKFQISPNHHTPCILSRCGILKKRQFGAKLSFIFQWFGSLQRTTEYMQMQTTSIILKCSHLTVKWGLVDKNSLKKSLGKGNNEIRFHKNYTQPSLLLTQQPLLLVVVIGVVMLITIKRQK